MQLHFAALNRLGYPLIILIVFHNQRAMTIPVSHPTLTRYCYFYFYVIVFAFKPYKSIAGKEVKKYCVPGLHLAKLKDLQRLIISCCNKSSQT